MRLSDRRYGEAIGRCAVCNDQSGLVRGLCEECAPTVHKNYRDVFEGFTTLADRFQAQTGRWAIGHWTEFQAFIAQQPEAEAFTAARDRDSRPDDPAGVEAFMLQVIAAVDRSR